MGARLKEVNAKLLELSNLARPIKNSFNSFSKKALVVASAAALSFAIASPYGNSSVNAKLGQKAQSNAINGKPSATILKSRYEIHYRAKNGWDTASPDPLAQWTNFFYNTQISERIVAPFRTRLLEYNVVAIQPKDYPGNMLLVNGVVVNNKGEKSWVQVGIERSWPTTECQGIKPDVYLGPSKNYMWTYEIWNAKNVSVIPKGGGIACVPFPATVNDGDVITVGMRIVGADRITLFAIDKNTGASLARTFNAHLGSYIVGTKNGESDGGKVTGPMWEAYSGNPINYKRNDAVFYAGPTNEASTFNLSYLVRVMAISQHAVLERDESGPVRLGPTSNKNIFRMQLRDAEGNLIGFADRQAFRILESDGR